MTIKYIIEEGDCISSIAAQYGFHPETLWNDKSNAALKDNRKDPNILNPGDVVHLPEKRAKTENRHTENRHVFRRKGFPEILRLRLLDKNKPLAGLQYRLFVGERQYDGMTNEDGRLKDHAIPPDAKSGKLFLGKGDKQIILDLDLGRIDPIKEAKGLQHRLGNLGFYSGKMDRDLGPRTTSAIKEFQEQHGVKVTGKPDGATLKKIQSEYGS